MGALIEKAETAKYSILNGYDRLIHDGLIEHLFQDDLEELKRMAIELERALRAEYDRRRDQ